jgi:hypothetical protein
VEQNIRLVVAERADRVFSVILVTERTVLKIR